MVMADIKGNVPAKILNIGAANTLEKLKRAHAYFMKTNTQEYDERELREEMKREELEFNDDFGIDGGEGMDKVCVSMSTRELTPRMEQLTTPRGR